MVFDTMNENVLKKLTVDEKFSNAANSFTMKQKQEYKSINELCQDIKRLLQCNEVFADVLVVSVQQYGITILQNLTAFVRFKKDIAKCTITAVPLAGNGVGKVKLTGIKEVKLHDNVDREKLFNILRMCKNIAVASIHSSKSGTIITFNTNSKDLCVRIADKYSNIKVLPGNIAIKVMNKKVVKEQEENTQTLLEILDKTPDNKIYLSSDWHIFKNRYKKEINYVNTSKIITWCRQNIKEDDILMYLGDICFRWCEGKDLEEVKRIMKSLPGIKVLVLGNHDLMLGEDFYSDCGFHYVMERFEWEKRNLVFTHKPEKMDTYGEEWLNIHGHIHNIKTYNDSDGSKNVNVYPLFYDGKPTTLSFLLKNKDRLMKDNEWNNNAMLGETCNMIDDAIEALSDMNEWAMNACNPVIGIHKPFILKVGTDENGLINTKTYALSPDIISDKYLVIDENSKLSIIDSDFIKDKYVEMYEYVGDSTRLGLLYKAYKEEAIVDNSFIYTCLSNKKLLSEDQIDFDESFVKIDLDQFQNATDTKMATMLQEWAKICGNDISFPVIESYGIKKGIIGMHDVHTDGFYYYNTYTGKRTKSVPRKEDLTESMKNSTY